MRRIVVLAILTFVAASCGGPRVTRLDDTTPLDLSGRWNDTDSRLVAEAMIATMLGEPWAADHARRHPDRAVPAILAGTVANRTLEYIDAGTFVAELQRAVTASGKARFVASRAERNEVRDERLDQSVHASLETQKLAGRETGADYLLKGELRSQEDRDDGRVGITYQVTLSLIDLETNEKVWVGDRKIRKKVRE